MTNQGVAEELIEVTSIADVRLGVIERRTATKSHGLATAVVELTIHAMRDDKDSAIKYMVRRSVNAGDKWRDPVSADHLSRSSAWDEADAAWKAMIGWIRHITPVPMRRRAGEDCSCHE